MNGRDDAGEGRAQRRVLEALPRRVEVRSRHIPFRLGLFEGPPRSRVRGKEAFRSQEIRLRSFEPRLCGRELVPEVSPVKTSDQGSLFDCLPGADRQLLQEPSHLEGDLRSRGSLDDRGVRHGSNGTRPFDLDEFRRTDHAALLIRFGARAATQSKESERHKRSQYGRTYIQAHLDLHSPFPD